MRTLEESVTGAIWHTNYTEGVRLGWTHREANIQHHKLSPDPEPTG